MEMQQDYTQLYEKLNVYSYAPYTRLEITSNKSDEIPGLSSVPKAIVDDRKVAHLVSTNSRNASVFAQTPCST